MINTSCQAAVSDRPICRGMNSVNGSIAVVRDWPCMACRVGLPINTRRGREIGRLLVTGAVRPKGALS